MKRHSSVIKRRSYSVSAPNAMWHVDSNHKLIRWRLVLHAGVDGFSRTIVYIVCANDNKATTALEGFLGGGLQDLEFLNVYGLTTEVKMWMCGGTCLKFTVKMNPVS